jgi:prepilin-type N-terminal cleavage/methylation domain-containing protein
MECKNIYIRAGNREAFTLIELMVATALSLVVATAIAILAYFASRSFVAMTHYTEMGQLSRLALDKMSMEIRQASQLTAYSAHSLSLKDVNGDPLQFTYDPTTRKLERVRGGTDITYLTDCDALQFSIYQHTMKSNTFDCYDPAYLTNARVIGVSWSCSRPILGLRATTDSMQSTKITFRNR